MKGQLADRVSSMKIKELTAENWLEQDAVSRMFYGLFKYGTRYSPTGDDWARMILEITLGDYVPTEVTDLFAVARGALVYGFLFYPLYTLGLEQVFRTAEAAVSLRCKLGGELDTKASFYEKIEWLKRQSLLSETETEKWHLVRKARNSSSHLEEQQIIPPGVSVGQVKDIVAMINSLFDAGTSKA